MSTVGEVAAALSPAIEQRVRSERAAEKQQRIEALRAISKAALRARQALANLDVDRSESALSRTLAGVKGELDEILDRTGPVDEEWRRVVAPELPPGALAAPNESGDVPLFGAQE